MCAVGAVMALTALLAAGCGGGSSEDTSGAEQPRRATEDRHASVLDKKLASTKAELPALDIPVGGGKSISFKDGEKLSVAYFGFGRGFPYTTPQYGAVESVGAELGMNVTTFDPAGDPAKQIDQIRTAASSGKYNTMVVYPLAPGLSCDLLTRQLPAKGILVVTVVQPPCPKGNTFDGLLTFVPDTGATETFTAFTEEVANLHKGSEKALLLGGPETDFFTQDAFSSIKKVLSQHPNVEILNSLYTDYTQPGSLQKMQDALQTYPDVSLVISVFPEGTQGAITALKLAGKNGQVAVYDVGANEIGTKGIESGDVAGSVPLYPYTTHKTAMLALALARRGEEVPRFIPYGGHAPESIRRQGADLLLVDKGNLKEYVEKLQEF